MVYLNTLKTLLIGKIMCIIITKDHSGDSNYWFSLAYLLSTRSPFMVLVLVVVVLVMVVTVLESVVILIGAMSWITSWWYFGGGCGDSVGYLAMGLQPPLVGVHVVGWITSTHLKLVLVELVKISNFWSAFLIYMISNVF
jgi:hypothetical protein